MYNSNIDYLDTLQDKESLRSNKLYKRTHPRGRRMVYRTITDNSEELRKRKRVDNAKNSIKKVIESFENLKYSEKNKREEIYIRWIRDSLQNGFPIIDIGDIKTKTSTSSVKAGGENRQKSRTSIRLTHIPTGISVKNEEERSLEQNRQNANNILKDKLSSHINYWKILANDLPNEFSISDIIRLGRIVLESIR